MKNCQKKVENIVRKVLTLSQTKNFRRFQTECYEEKFMSSLKIIFNMLIMHRRA